MIPILFRTPDQLERIEQLELFLKVYVCGKFFNFFS